VNQSNIIPLSPADIAALTAYMGSSWQTSQDYGDVIGSYVSNVLDPVDPGFYVQLAVPTGVTSGANAIAVGCGWSTGCHINPTDSITLGSASVQLTNNVNACLNGLTLNYVDGVAISVNDHCLALGAGYSVDPFDGSAGTIFGLLSSPSYGEPDILNNKPPHPEGRIEIADQFFGDDDEDTR
jgi:hypothetical protein